MFYIIFKWNGPMASNSGIVHGALCSPNVSIWIFLHMMNNAKKQKEKRRRNEINVAGKVSSVLTSHH